MGTSWEELGKQESPDERAKRERAEREAERTAKIDREKYYVINCDKFPRVKKELYELLGFEQDSENYGRVPSSTVKTGEVFIEKVSSDRYQVTEGTKTTGGHDLVVNVLKIERSKISDMDRFLELTKEVDVFYEEQSKRFVRVSPTHFNAKIRHKERIPVYIALFCILALPVAGLLASFGLVIPALIVAALAAGFIVYRDVTFVKRHQEYLPWVEAYNAKIEYFKEEVKKITTF